MKKTIRMIANAVFVLLIVKGSKIRLTFDKPQTASTALFTHETKSQALMLLAEDLRQTMNMTALS